MSDLRLVLRERAVGDVEAAVDRYAAEAGPETALRFVDGFEQACARLRAHPELGSPRYAHALDIPGLRAWRVEGFPHLLFYRLQDGTIDVWRVLHGRRDVPTWLGEP